MQVTWRWVAALCALSSLAEAQTTIDPDWIRKPTTEEMWRVVPAEAARLGRGGEAVVGCLVNVEGGLHSCTILSETPKGLGFGPAGLAMTPMFRMRPQMRDGRSVAGGNVRIPIRWRIGAPLPTSGVTVIKDVAWVAGPSFDQLLASYPDGARSKGESGRVTLLCKYARDGRISDCQTFEESPRREGFATAAKTLSPLFRGPPLSPELAREPRKAMVTVTYAAGALAGDKRVGSPDWRALPTADDLVDAYPPAALKEGLAGRASVRCRVNAEGGLETCAVASETPAGRGFGDAAVKALQRARLSVWSDEGLPTVGGELVIPVRFQTTEPAVPVSSAER